MAVSKKSQRNVEPPDPAAFVRLIEEGLADPTVVSAAYQRALREYTSGKTYAELQQEAYQRGDIVQERPVIDPDEQKTPGARMVELARAFMFKDGGR